MRRSVLETALAAMVLLVAGVFLVFASNIGNVAPVKGYEVVAKFNSTDGLALGNDVRIGGVKVGAVVGQEVDPRDFKAMVSMTIRPDVRLTKDTLVSIGNDGLLGGNYIKLELSGGGHALIDGAELTKTKDVISLGELLQRVLVLVRDGPSAKTYDF